MQGHGTGRSARQSAHTPSPFPPPLRQSQEEEEASVEVARLSEANRRLNAVSDFVQLSRNQRSAIALEKRLAQLKAQRRSNPRMTGWLSVSRYATWLAAALLGLALWNMPLVQLPMNWLAPAGWALSCCHGARNHLGSWPWIVMCMQWVPAAVDAAVTAAGLQPKWVVADAAEAATASGVVGQLKSLLKGVGSASSGGE